MHPQTLTLWVQSNRRLQEDISCLLYDTIASSHDFRNNIDTMKRKVKLSVVFFSLVSTPNRTWCFCRSSSRTSWSQGSPQLLHIQKINQPGSIDTVLKKHAHLKEYQRQSKKCQRVWSSQQSVVEVKIIYRTCNLENRRYKSGFKKLLKFREVCNNPPHKIPNPRQNIKVYPK